MVRNVAQTNHIHLIVQSDKVPLNDIIRDFKKFTATAITKAIANNPKKSRERWLLWLLKKEDNRTGDPDLVFGRGLSWRRDF